MSTFSLIFSASPIVMMVLLLLVSFSLLTWAILYFKWKLMKKSAQSTNQFLDIFWSGKSMDFIYAEAKKLPSSPVARIFQSGYKELQRLIEREKQKTQEKEAEKNPNLIPPASSIENLERSLTVANRNETMKLESSMTFLATAASTSPFIGLFGTVWGIMNAFQNIGIQGSASLATVAPGIAEALIATAVGLACAIPATMGYNYFIQKIRYIRNEMENFSSDFLNIVKRNFLSN